jgi:hypothetical protein
VVNAKSKRHCLVLNASALGRHLGEVHFRVPDAAGEAVSWSDASLVPVDESVVPDPQMAASTQSAVESIEQLPYLPNLLGRVTGEAVANDPNQPGDLYFAPIAKTGFDVTDTHSVVYLSADAMLAAADDWGKAASVKTDMALESAGVIRQGLNRGKSGVISAADAFDVVPLGASPVDGSVGYPLVRANLLPFELRAVFEVARTQGPTDSDYDLGMAGARVEYDATRPLVQSAADLFDPTKGQVMRIMIDSDHSDGFDQFDQVIYDRDQGIQSTTLVSVVTSSYIAQFASSAGVTTKDDAGNEISVEQAILERPDQSELKQIEAFFGYLHAMPGGTLADRYDRASAGYTERWVCLNGC